jgi:hypothetical protein
MAAKTTHVETIRLPYQVIDIPPGTPISRRRSDPGEYPQWWVRGRKLYVASSRYRINRVEIVEED